MIYIIVPTFGQLNETKSFISRLKSEEIIFVIIDAHPSAVFRRELIADHVVVIESLNAYWSKAVNEGITYLRKLNLNYEDSVVIANSDVVIKLESVKKLRSKLRDSILHPRTFNQDSIEVSSGSVLISWFPYITKTPRNPQQDTRVDFSNARFMMMSLEIFNKLDLVPSQIVQYQGDNYLSFQIWRKHGVKTLIVHDVTCAVDDTHTGLKNGNILTLKDLLRSFYVRRSANNIRNRYFFVSHFTSKIFALLIVLSMTINSVLKYYYYKWLR